MLKSTIATCRRLLITKEAISPAYRPQLTTRRYLAFQTMTVPQHSSLSKIEINVDCGEAFGNWQAGPDEELMPMIDVANVACGGHAGSPVVMKRTIDLAKKFGVKVGAHPGFPDKAGFGRRVLHMNSEEAYTEVLYQVGALKTFLDAAGMSLNHVKPHGMLYIMMQTDETLSDAAMRAIKHFNVPVYGLPGTLHETFAAKYNIPFIPEAFADVNYSNDGVLLGVPGSRKLSPQEIHDVTKQLGMEGVLPSVGHKLIDVGVAGKPFTLCLHSDFAACRENLAAARKAVDAVNEELYT